MNGDLTMEQVELFSKKESLNEWLNENKETIKTIDIKFVYDSLSNKFIYLVHHIVLEQNAQEKN